MARALRIELKNGWYHVANRGNNGQAIYLDNRDRRHFLDLISEMIERYSVEVHAYVLMSNHYHLMVEAGEDLSRARCNLNFDFAEKPPIFEKRMAMRENRTKNFAPQ